MKDAIVLVRLTPDQIELAKNVNGKRQQITHALLCGKYGQLFGTEKHCLKYFNVWKMDMKKLFSKAVITDNHEISDYTSTFNLVMVLLKALD